MFSLDLLEELLNLHTMAEGTYRLTLEVTEEQELAIQAFFAHSDWDFQRVGK